MNRMDSHTTSDSGSRKAIGQSPMRARALRRAEERAVNGIRRMRCFSAWTRMSQVLLGGGSCITNAGAPGVEGLPVSAGELCEPEERHEALPVALAGFPGVRLRGPSRLARCWAGFRSFDLAGKDSLMTEFEEQQ